MQMCNVLQHIFLLSALSATGQRGKSHRISNYPTGLLQSAGSRVGGMMQSLATRREVIKFRLIQICVNQSNYSLFQIPLRRLLNNTAFI